MSHFSWKNGQKMPFFHVFWVTRQNFLGSRWNISTNEPVLERLLNFWTYFKLIAHLVRSREPPKAKNLKIRVTRKPDLETQNWVYSFSSFIEPYQTHIVTAQMLFDCWTVLWAFARFLEILIIFELTSSFFFNYTHLPSIGQLSAKSEINIIWPWPN